MPCSPSDPPPIPVSWGPMPPASPPPELTPKPPVLAQGLELPRLTGPRPASRERPKSECVLQLAIAPTAAGWARRHTADVLGRWGLSDLADDCCLVVSELVTNVVRHAAPHDEPAACRLVLKLYVEAVAVEVWDPSSDTDLCPREENTLSESGRGLAIVTELCGAPPAVFAMSGGGKTVVAIIPYCAA